MEITVDRKSAEKIKAEVLVFLLDKKGTKKIKNGKHYPKTVIETIKRGDFRGEFEDLMLISGERGVKRILLAGLGENVTTEKIRRACSIVVSKIKTLKLDEISFYIEKTSKINEMDFALSIVEGTVLSDYTFDKYKTEERKKSKKIQRLFLHSNGADPKKLKEEAERVKRICENTNFVRNLVNETSDVMTPEKIAETAKKVAKKNKLKIKVMNEKELKKRGFNLILGVGQGSRYSPRLIIIEYIGNKKSKEKVALLGKGITFDSGGLNLKPSGYIENMKLDKTGAVTVLGIMKALAETNAKVNVVGIMPCCENMIGPNSYKPGDILTSYGGKTVEVLDTDAEGRLIMADSLEYIERKIKPSLIIDMATLTGSIMITFGEYVAGMFSTKRDYGKKLFEAGQKTYERVWELPLYDEYKDEMKGEISDVKNLGYKNGRYAGAITAAAFLNNFVEKTPWIHLDIAGTGWYEKKRYYIPQGGTGFGVRLIMKFLENFEK